MTASTQRDHTGFSIRTAVPSDVPAIRAVLLTVRREYRVHCECAAADPDLDDLAGNYFQRGGHFEVIEDSQGHIVGCAGLRPLNARRVELCKMYIEPAGRGRGLGRQLLENMLAAARRSGFREVWLATNSVLVRAKQLYTQYGFQPVPVEEQLPGCDQAYLLRLENSP